MTFKNLIIALVIVAFSVAPATAQFNTLTQTTLSAAVAVTDTVITVASATGIVAPNLSTGVVGSLLFVLTPGTKGEVMYAQSISSTSITVKRQGNRRASTSGAIVLIGAPNLFYTVDPQGACTAATTLVTPYVNVANGQQWLCSTIMLSWVPGWGNAARDSALPTAAVASAAGTITPSGPLFHVTGTAAITGFVIPVGYNAGGFCVIPDGIFTTTTAGNIALASTSVVSKLLCWGYDAAAAKPFFPTY